MNRGPNNAMGNSMANGPGTRDWQWRRQGLDPRPATLYDAMHGREPA